MNDASRSPARARIVSLLDADSFVEIGASVTARSTDFTLSEKKAPSDGVITGYGQIDGRPVYIYSQDVSVLNGTMGEMHAGKILRLYELALKTGDPVIGLLDCAGMRLEEGLDALHAFGSIYRAQTEASGVVPQITAVYGTCGGGMALVPALSDFTFIEQEKGHLFLSSPNSIPENTEEKCDTSEASRRYADGDADLVGTQEEIAAKIRELIGYLPSNFEEDPWAAEAGDLNAVQEDLQQWAADPAQILLKVSDQGSLFEVRPGYAPEMFTALARIGGYNAGIIANRSAVYGPEGTEETFQTVLTAKGASKAAKFLSFCDAFSIPVITFANVTGLEASFEAEQELPGAAARLAGTAAVTTSPRITVITGSAYGTAALLMNSRSLGADLVYAWKDARIGLMEASSAAKILASGSAEASVSDLEQKYDELQNSSASAAARGYVDTLIDPAETRKYLIGALDMLFTKRSDAPRKKHLAF